MADLVRFKTATLTAFGYQRNGVWDEETASQKVEHLGLMFGALAASPSGAVHGFGVPLEKAWANCEAICRPLAHAAGLRPAGE